MPSAKWRAAAAPGSCMAAFMPLCSLRKRCERGEAHAVVKGDGDVVWSRVVADCLAGNPSPVYEGGRIEGSQFLAARWDLMDPRKIHVGFRADHPRMSQALLLLQRVAHRRPEAPAAKIPEA